MRSVIFFEIYRCLPNDPARVSLGSYTGQTKINEVLVYGFYFRTGAGGVRPLFIEMQKVPMSSPWADVVDDIYGTIWNRVK